MDTAVKTYSETAIEEMLTSFKQHTYHCSICDKTIFPLVEFADDCLRITRQSCDIRGGKKNKLLKSDVCDSCAKLLTSNRPLADCKRETADVK